MPSSREAEGLGLDEGPSLHSGLDFMGKGVSSPFQCHDGQKHSTSSCTARVLPSPQEPELCPKCTVRGSLPWARALNSSVTPAAESGRLCQAPQFPLNSLPDRAGWRHGPSEGGTQEWPQAGGGTEGDRERSSGSQAQLVTLSRSPHLPRVTGPSGF